jgi:septum formation protein
METELWSYEILLASESERRIALMEKLGLPFRVVSTGHTDEHYPSHLKGGKISVYLAEHKSDAYAEPLTNREVLLTADTVVWHRGKDLGKPAGYEEAVGMIRSLSGDTHQVYTGVCLRSKQKKKSFYASTGVAFAEMTDREIETYVKRYRPYDKAGGYGIQEWIGYIAVEKIHGSYLNVIGLPVQRVYAELKKMFNTESGNN